MVTIEFAKFAMPTNILVWDLETVPDFRGFAATYGLDRKSDDEIREVMGDKFPKISSILLLASAH